MDIIRLIRRSCITSRLRNVCLAVIGCAWLLEPSNTDADGCFVFHWNKQKDINEPTQKAIILYSNGCEDMVLQVKYEGPAEDFGWLVPVPSLPEVRKGSMDCFYEVSRLTQRRFAPDTATFSASLGLNKSEDDSVKVIEVKTVGAYEVTVLSATNAASLADWLDAHHFAFPKEEQNVLDDYIKKQWYFVAAKIDPNEDGFVVLSGLTKKRHDRAAISPSIQRRLANGELHPLVMRFRSPKCVFPLAISIINGKPSEVSLYILSPEPLASRAIFDKRFATYSRERADWIKQAPERRKKRAAQMQKRAVCIDNLQKLHEAYDKSVATRHLGLPAGTHKGRGTWDDDPADPPPNPSIMRQLMGEEDWLTKALAYSEGDFPSGTDLVQSLEVDSKDLPKCAALIPGLRGNSWWLTKQVEVFAPDEMRDLEFEPAIPMLAGKLQPTDGPAAALYCLSKLGKHAVPVMLAASRSPDPNERRLAVENMEVMEDARLTAAMPGLLGDPDARVRSSACYSAVRNWDAAFIPRLEELLGDSNADVRSAACCCLGEHMHGDNTQIPIFMKLLEEDGVAAPEAIKLLDQRSFSREQLVHLLSSTNLPVVGTGFGLLRNQNLKIEEIEPLLTNSLAMARMMGLQALTEIGDKKAVDRIVAMLREPNEAIRWHVRARLRLLTGQKLGPDPAAWEKWWATNKNNFNPRPSSGPVPKQN